MGEELAHQSLFDEPAEKIDVVVGSVLRSLHEGRATTHDIYEWWDGCLILDMLSEEGNAFAMHYFGFEHGRYMQDYKRTLQRRLPTEYHVAYTEDGYTRLRQVIDRRYQEWKAPRKRWWPF